MKKIILFLLIVVPVVFARAQYAPADQGSTVQFKIKNFGFNVTGSFSGLKGSINFDPNNPAGTSFDVSIDANTINTGIDARDNHLREDSYFDVKNYPQIRFVSDKVTKSSGKDGDYEVSGKLTIKNHTKDISFPFTATAADNGYLFKGQFKINRKDFDVGGSSTISNNLEVSLSVLAKKK
jgi:polyisoprenoid-binding protein YceI